MDTLLTITVSHAARLRRRVLHKFVGGARRIRDLLARLIDVFEAYVVHRYDALAILKRHDSLDTHWEDLTEEKLMVAVFQV